MERFRTKKVFLLMEAKKSGRILKWLYVEILLLRVHSLYKDRELHSPSDTVNQDLLEANIISLFINNLRCNCRSEMLRICNSNTVKSLLSSLREDPSSSPENKAFCHNKKAPQLHFECCKPTYKPT